MRTGKTIEMSEDDLDAETVAAIIRAELQLDQGLGIDFAAFAAEMRSKIALAQRQPNDSRRANGSRRHP